MAEHKNTVPENEGTSRRSLLAKAAAAGAVVYAAPVVSSIPAYAAGGLASFNHQSSPVCVWFSPAQNSKNGKWFADVVNTTDGIVAKADSGVGQTMTVNVKVNGTNRAVRFSGAPVNAGASNSAGLPGTGDPTDPATPKPFYGGGGVFIESIDASCEISIESIVCNKQDKSPCANSNETDNGPASWAVGSSDSSIIGGLTAPAENVGDGSFQTAYYHSGRTGAGGSGKCRVSFIFRVRCT